MKTKKIPINLYLALALVFLILPMLVGCGTISAGAVQPEQENLGAAETESGGIDLGEIGTIEVGVEPTPLPEGITYTNETYEFAFEYPETWTLTEEDHGVVLQQGPNRLAINFRWADEQIDRFGRTGMGAGDLIYAGKVNFMNQVIPAEALFFERKSKAVFYGESGKVEIGDRVFTIALEDLETDYLEIDLPEGVIAEANTILGSFRDLAATGGETSAAPSGLEAHLIVQSPVQQGGGEPIVVNFLLENHGQEAVYLLKWFTPFEGFGGDIFKVTRDSVIIPYQGPQVSRTAPTPESYVYVEPGQGVAVEVNLAEAYDFSQIGTYTIEFRSPRISHLARSEAEMATTMDDLGPVEILSNEVTLEVVASTAGMGEPVRRTAEEAGELISAQLLAQKPGLMEAPPLAFEELPDERIWEELQGQVFRVTEGIFKNESFFLRHDRVVQLGEALGGQGLTSLVVSDLDQDGQAELLFSYIAGLGPGIGPGTQTRVGMVEPDSGALRVIEADMAYLGVAALRLEEPTVVSLNVVEAVEAIKVLRFLDKLGYLSIENQGSDETLMVNFDPNLPPEIKRNILAEQ